MAIVTAVRASSKEGSGLRVFATSCLFDYARLVARVSGPYPARRARPSQVKFLLSTQIQNSPPLVPGAGVWVVRAAGEIAHSWLG